MALSIKTLPVKRVAKAVTAGVTGLAGSYTTAVSDGTVTTSEWGLIAATTVVASLATFYVPNALAPNSPGLR